MGVSYYFSGEFEIAPPVSKALRDEINEGQGHGYVHEGDYYPWEINDEGNQIGADEDDEIRNVWDCGEDLAALVKMLTALGHTITGEILGSNSEEENYWKFTTEHGRVDEWQGYIGYRNHTPIEIGDANANEAV